MQILYSARSFVLTAAVLFAIEHLCVIVIFMPGTDFPTQGAYAGIFIVQILLLYVKSIMSLFPARVFICDQFTLPI